MKVEEMLDLIHELIVVDSVDGFTVSSVAFDNEISFSTRDNENFKIKDNKTIRGIASKYFNL